MMCFLGGTMPRASTEGSDQEVSVWAILSLYEFVDIAKSRNSIISEVKETLGKSIEVFLPVDVKNIASRNIEVNLFDGYVFVRHPGSSSFEDDLIGFRGSYIEGPLLKKNKVSYISGSEINKYTNQMKEMVYTFTPSEGELVIGIEGTFSNLKGVVRSVNHINKTADVLFRTRTREVYAENISFLFLESLEDF